MQEVILSWENSQPEKTKQFIRFVAKRQVSPDQKHVIRWTLFPILQDPTPYDIIQMADAYKRPDLCNYYCSHKCEIGHRYVPEVKVTDLSNIILETIASLNEINPLTGRLIQIARDGKISDDEMKDFAYISKKLNEISLAIDSLNLWVDKTASEQKLNLELLHREKDKLR